MIFRTMIAAVMTAACIVGCSQTSAVPDEGPKVKSQSMVPEGAPKIKGSTDGGETREAQ